MEGLVFCNGRFGYKNLPKIASTTIKCAIYEIETGEKFNIEEKGIHVHSYMKKNNKSDISSCEHRFIVIRDPVKRFLSGYKNRVVYHRQLSEPFVKDRFKDLYWKIPHFSPGLGQFIENLETYLLVRPMFHHLSPISDLIGRNNLHYFTHIYKFEDLLQFESELSRLLGKEVTFGHMQAGGGTFHVNDLNRKQMKKVIKYYREDYKLLKGFYSVEELWEEWEGQRHDPEVPKSFPDGENQGLFSTLAGRLKKLITGKK